MHQKAQRDSFMSQAVKSPADPLPRAGDKSSIPPLRVAIPAPPEPGKLRWSLAPL